MCPSLLFCIRSCFYFILFRLWGYEVCLPCVCLFVSLFVWWEAKAFGMAHRGPNTYAQSKREGCSKESAVNVNEFHPPPARLKVLTPRCSPPGLLSHTLKKRCCIFNETGFESWFQIVASEGAYWHKHTCAYLIPTSQQLVRLDATERWERTHGEMGTHTRRGIYLRL